MAKTVPEILDKEELEGMPDSVVISVPLTDDLKASLIEPSVRWLAASADAVVDLEDGRLRAGVSFNPGMSRIMFDFEETANEFLDTEDLPLAIVALERMMLGLQALLPESAEERAELRPSNYDELPGEDQLAIDRALGLDGEEDDAV